MEPDDGSHLHGPAARHPGPAPRRGARSRGGCRAAPARHRGGAHLGGGLPAKGHGHRSRHRDGAARPPPVHLGDAGRVVRRPPGTVEQRRPRAVGAPRCPPRHRARGHRHAPAVRHLRPVGRRRRLHRLPGRHRAAHDRDLRRHARWGGRRRARLRSRRPPSAGHPPEHRRLSLRRRLPVVHPEPEVRQRQRPPRQARRAPAAGGDPRPAS